ncbi:hypothetical protein K443DRAFT_11576 [Laccaria amethystina LaAM-08-1]|uniref:Uncharacterized protein n=1 Tax=Laccaria amethystina LaAM-08-1 TaxID=1095629 RepID=A0A0C9X1L2_9AGAR|nr:hypothetical protein K443DRAFT_11576 [Laccaria amethystina LaAM-08-1]
MAWGEQGKERYTDCGTLQRDGRTFDRIQSGITLQAAHTSSSLSATSPHVIPLRGVNWRSNVNLSTPEQSAAVGGRMCFREWRSPHFLQWGTAGSAIVVVWFTPTIGLGWRLTSYIVYPFYHRLDPACFSSIITHYATTQPLSLNRWDQPVDLHLPSAPREVDRHPQLHLDLHLMHVPAQQLLG